MTEYRKVFLDTTPLIYFLDADINFGKITENIFYDFLSSGVNMITSAITCTEYLTFPYKTGNVSKINVFYEFLGDCGIPILPITVQVAQKAAEIRGNYSNFKTMDCLQLATACVHNCDLFLTNDKQLRQFKEIKCVTVEEFI